MAQKTPVKVFWYPAEERGRKAPPAGPKYYAVVRFDSGLPSSQDWSVLLEFGPRSQHLYCRDAMLSFVSDGAPIASMSPGVAFHLFEGRWPVAEGVVIQPTEIDVDRALQDTSI